MADFKRNRTMLVVIVLLGVLHVACSQEWHFSGVNIAKDRNATQLPESPRDFSAGLAVDGDTNTNFSLGSCSETGVSYQDDANWTVYLDMEYELKGIRIYNRDNYEYRLANFSIVGGPTSMILWNPDQTTYNESVIDIIITSNGTFSEITIQIPAHTGWPDDGNSTLSLCEVEVYSVVNDCMHTSIPDNVTWEIRSETGFNNTEYVSSGSTLDLSCSPGQILRGASTVTCLSNGSFSADVFGCFVNCSTLPAIVNGAYTNQDVDYFAGDYIYWNCSTGYYSGVANPRQCLSNGSWSGQDPNCSIVSCSFPGSVTNGSLSFPNGTEYISGEVTYGTLVNVTCDESFQPLPPSIECNRTGNWNITPECLQIECPSLGDTTGGFYEYSRNGTVVPDMNVYVYGTEAELVCNESMYRTPNGMSVYRMCGADMSWTGSDDMCSALCQLPDLQNGSYHIGNMVASEAVYEVNQAVIPVCNSGYKLNDSNLFNQSRTCQSDHTWSMDEPFCIRITCSVPVVPLNGTLKQDGSDVMLGDLVESGNTIKVLCDTGFEPKISSITCQESGTWDGQAECMQVRCPPLPPLANGAYEYTLNGDVLSDTNSDFAYGTMVTAACNGGVRFRLNLDGVRVCEQDRSWSGQAKECIPRCETPSLKNGSYGDDNGGTEEHYDKDMSITPVCDVGYEFHQLTPTDRSRTCQSNHSWNGPEPQCNIITCSVRDFQTGQNFYGFTEKNDNDVEYDRMVTTNCLEGYERQSGDTVRKCLSNKTFSGVELVCTEIESSNVGAAVGATIGVLVAVCLIGVLVYIFYFRKRRQSHDTIDPVNIRVQYTKRGGIDSVNSKSFSMTIEPQNGISNQNAVDTMTSIKPVEQSRPKSFMDMNTLADFVISTDFDSKDFTDDFMTLKQGLTKPHEAASRNPTKNRFDKILAYDETRVTLDVWDEETDTDYINANYVAGYTDPHAYIACQGPTEETFSDFWRMVWQQDCEIIVMLTNLTEGEKVQCGQYWPSEGDKTYGKVTVTLKKETIFAHFVIRTFSLGKTGDPDKEVVQYHFTTWPEDRCPEVCMRVLNFCNKANDKENIIQGPMVVHCSDGAGRTGTFIAIDYLTEQSLEEGTVVVADCVRSMRDLRPDMVQTKVQYMFIHRALVESFLLNTFDVSSDDFPEVYTSLLSTDPIRGKPKIDVDYDNLQRIAVKAPSGDLKHVEKNRNPNNIPAIEYMPSIEKPGVTSGGDDYINAVFLPTYKRQNGLIIAESPLESTKGDFWKLVYQQKVTTIVMMNNASALDEKEVYWPQKDETVTFGELAITHKEVTENSGHSVLSLSLKRADEERDVTLIQFGKWQPGTPVPADNKDMLSAIKLVASMQPEDSSAPVLVHCMNGAEMSGLFCVIAVVLEREKIEESVAVPQIIQEIQSRRAGIIPNVEQFRCCYEVVLEHMKSKKTSSFKT